MILTNKEKMLLTPTDGPRLPDVRPVLGRGAAKATGETLTAPSMDSVNAFEAPDDRDAEFDPPEFRDGKLVLTVEPKSVTVVSLQR